MASILELIILGSVRLLTGAQARWQGCAPTAQQRIYYANHTSHLDFVMVASALPALLRRQIRPVAAAEYWTAGPLRRYLIHTVFRGVLVERERRSLNPLEPVLEALRGGASLIIFPEGTRGTGDSLQPFKPGIFHIAKMHPSVNLVPVWIDNSYRIMPKGFLFPVPLLCSMTFGEPIRWDGKQSQEEFLLRISTALESLCPQ
jgi:1-acyl-sn-glycerol-3-phosphate acyltransferase